jgi:hypothetical protein
MPDNTKPYCTTCKFCESTNSDCGERPIYFCANAATKQHDFMVGFLDQSARACHLYEDAAARTRSIPIACCNESSRTRINYRGLVHLFFRQRFQGV